MAQGPEPSGSGSRGILRAGRRGRRVGIYPCRPAPRTWGSREGAASLPAQCVLRVQRRPRTFLLCSVCIRVSRLLLAAAERERAPPSSSSTSPHDELPSSIVGTYLPIRRYFPTSLASANLRTCPPTSRLSPSRMASQRCTLHNSKPARASPRLSGPRHLRVRLLPAPRL